MTASLKSLLARLDSSGVMRHARRCDASEIQRLIDIESSLRRPRRGLIKRLKALLSQCPQ